MNYYNPQIIFACVDPGLRGCGVALFKGGELLKAAYVKNPVESGGGYEAHARLGKAVSDYLDFSADQVIIEHPRVYPGSAQQKGDLNDLLDVVAVGAACAGWNREGMTETVYPFDWKGNVPKDIMTARIRTALSSDELSRIEPCPANLKHNILDACGIGLWKLKRINQRKIHND